MPGCTVKNIQGIIANGNSYEIEPAVRFLSILINTIDINQIRFTDFYWFINSTKPLRLHKRKKLLPLSLTMLFFVDVSEM